MVQFRAFGWSLLCALGLSGPVWAQDGDRIWGQVHTKSGEVHEGFIRWDRNEGSWVDILDGSKGVPGENYLAWLESKDAEGPPLRTIDLLGYRITWEEADPDFPPTSRSGIRFGQLTSLRVIGPDRVELRLRSGELLELEGGGTDLGASIRELVVDVPGRSPVELDWSDLDRVLFSAVPSGARAAARRLYGTVEDGQGNRYTGYVSWDLDEILETDVLDGEEMNGGKNYDIRFGEIVSIARVPGGARVVLVDGDERDLTGNRDVDRGNRGIQISDPGLGMVEVEWREFRILRFHEANAVVGYDTFDGGHLLLGTVVTQSGEEIDGVIRWDQTNWASVDQSVIRYTALVQQRIAAAIRTPLKDRIIYRNETAVRAFWDQDYDAVVQVLGTRSQYPGRSIAVREGDLDWLDDLPFDEPFEPGGERLLLGLGDQDDDDDDEDDYWIAHPLAHGADSLYRYESGDTLTLGLPDGRQLQTIQLDVLPREADVHRITGTLWIEPESGALVRAVYRLSRQFDAMRDVPEVQEKDERGSFRYVPGLFKPWTFDLTMVAVDYSLWNFEVWLPRSMRMEGEVGAGILKMPVSMDLSYRIESVTTRSDLAQPETAAQAGLVERHFESRAEAMAFIAQLLSEEDGIEYEAALEEFARERTSFMIVPEVRSTVATSPHLPPPIWEDAAGFPSDDQIEDYVNTLAALPAPRIQGIPWAANWGWARPDLLRYNRVEGPALGGRFEASLGGPYTLDASGYFGFADLKPKARLNFERTSVRRRLRLGVYNELTATDPRGRYLGFGNSMYAFLFGRDEGEYYRASGADFTWRPPVGARESFEFRAYVERQASVPTESSFALFRVFNGSWGFRPNIDADDVEEGGAELRFSPWRGGDPFRTQFGLDLYAHGARWRTTGETAGTNYARASAILRAAIPLVYPTWRLGLEVGGGTTWGNEPLQRSWFLGGARTLRGYSASATMGSSFARARLEVARTYDIGTVSVFGDVGWAGLRKDFNGDDLLYGVGLGGSVLDGLFRMDLSHGLTGPDKQFRIDLYLDALL